MKRITNNRLGVFRAYAKHLKNHPLYQQELINIECLLKQNRANVWIGIHPLGNTCLVAHVKDDYLWIDMVIGGSGSLRRYFETVKEIAKVVDCKGFRCKSLSKSRERFYSQLGFKVYANYCEYKFKR